MVCTYCKHKFKWEMDGDYMSEKNMNAYPHFDRPFIDRLFAFSVNSQTSNHPYRSRPPLTNVKKLWLKGDTAMINKM